MYIILKIRIYHYVQQPIFTLRQTNTGYHATSQAQVGGATDSGGRSHQTSKNTTAAPYLASSLKKVVCLEVREVVVCVLP